jgi:hypothetical protein
MHRGGTSSIAGALVRLGGNAPLHLMPPEPGNERGFWESPVVMALNEDILAAGHSGWTDWRKFDCDRIGARAANALRERAKATLMAEFGDAGIPVIKDPRMCRLMRFWAPAFEEVGWSARAVLPLRSPLEVAWSLERRDGLEPSLGCLMWLRHVLDAEVETRGMTRAILNWSGFLSDSRPALGQVIDRLGVDWPRCSEEGLADVDAFVSDDLRHCKADEDELQVHPAIGELACEVYDRMLSLVDDPSNAWSLSRLDALRADFETAVALFDPAMRHFERALAQANRRLEQANLVIAHVAERYAAQTSSANGGWFPRLRNSARRRTALKTVSSSAFFDAAYYLAANPDVRASGCDPAVHYLKKGAREGRDPGPFFCTTAYLARNPDVADAGVNPLVHYEIYGRKEGRSAIAPISSPPCSR